MRAQLAAIPWERYATGYGNAAGQHAFETAAGAHGETWGSIADQLQGLASEDPEVALAASHHLWSCLCHQHAYVSSAALPALPFLLEVLSGASDQLAIEIMDILLGFATCTSDPTEAWMRELREQLIASAPVLERFAGHANDELAHFAQALVVALAAPSAIL